MLLIKDLVKKVTLIFVVNLSSRTKAKESFQIKLHNLEIFEEIKSTLIHNCMEVTQIVKIFIDYNLDFFTDYLLNRYYKRENSFPLLR